MTVDVVLGCSVDEVESVAVGLRADARAIDTIGERLPFFPTSWTGAAADAAAGRFEELQSLLAAISGVVTGCAQVLFAAMTSLRPARDGIVRAARCAGTAGLQLSPEGLVALPQTATATAAAGAGVLVALSGERSLAAAAAAALARAALGAAAEVDADAALALARASDVLPVLAVPWLGAAWPLPPWQVVVPPAVCLPAGVGGLAAIWLPAQIPADASPLDVAAWWSVLPPAAQATLVGDQPDRIGLLEGLPAQVRHDANVAVLARELALAQAVLLRAQGQRRLHRSTIEAAQRLGLLLAVRRVLLADPARRLVSLDFSEGGLAAVAVGDVDAATDVAVVVPGLNQSVVGDLDTVVVAADNIRSAAIGLTQYIAPGRAVAAIAWIGYRTPTFATVASDHRAKVGGRRFASFAAGLDGAREISRLGTPAAPLHLTAVGYSYGSTVVGYAMRHRPPVDDVVFLGSPGVGADKAGDIDPGGGHVFVGEARDDPIADLSWFGTDPSSSHFGARALQTDGGIDAVTGAPLRASYGHFQYFDSGTESVRNVAAVTVGAPQLATYGDMSGAGDQFVGGMDVLIR